MVMSNIDIEQFVKDYDRMTDKELAVKYGVSPRTIRNYASRLRTQGRLGFRRNGEKVVQMTDYSTYQDAIGRDELVKAFSKYGRKEDVAEYFGVTTNKVTRLCKEKGVEYLLKDEGGLTKEELLKLLALYKNKKVVAEKLGVTVHKITKMCKMWNILDEKERTRESMKMLDKMLSVLKPYKNMPCKKDIAPEHFVVHFTDWHAGKRVVRENDKVTFDIDIFKKRVDRMLERVLYLLDRHVKVGSDIGMVDILNTGDLANGEGIYSGQEFQQMAPPPDQVMLVVEAQVKFVMALLKAGYPVKMHCVKGNHGRTSKDNDPASNWDVMIYKIIDFWQKYNRVDNFEMVYTESDYLNTTINGWKYHLRHIAFEQGDTSAGRSKFHGWGAMHDIDAIVFGHWHHWGCFPVDHIRVFRGGSLVGPDEFSDRLGKSSEPIQLVWGIPTNRVSSFVYPVDLRL